MDNFLDTISSQHSYPEDGLTLLQINRVAPDCIYEPASPDEEELTCCVCVEAVEPGNRMRSLPCKHCYHPDCIDRWLQMHRTCPMCKAVVPSE